MLISEEKTLIEFYSEDNAASDFDITTHNENTAIGIYSNNENSDFGISTNRY